MKVRAFFVLVFIAVALMFPKLGASVAVGSLVLARVLWMLVPILRFIVGNGATPPAK